MTRVGIVGYYSKVDSSSMATSELIRFTTANLGNMMFRYAVCSDVGSYVEIRTEMDPAVVRELVDVLVLPMANNINPSFNMGYLARFIERCDLPVVAVGLGAQAKLGKSGVENLEAGSIRFLKVLAERGEKIGVRGPFTAQVLLDHGVGNAEVMGCPSNFIRQCSNLGAELEAERSRVTCDAPARVAFYSQLGRKNFESPNIESERILFELAKRNGAFYLHNSPEELIDLSRGRARNSAGWINGLRQHLHSNLSAREFECEFRKISHAFTSVEAWMEFSASCDLSIGKRVHGSLNSIQSGTFGVLVFHDERTLELGRTLGLPLIDARTIDTSDSLSSILDRVEFSGKVYDSNRMSLAASYDRILATAGIESNNEYVIASRDGDRSGNDNHASSTRTRLAVTA